jgi:hypothetical protein
MSVSNMQHCHAVSQAKGEVLEVGKLGNLKVCAASMYYSHRPDRHASGQQARERGRGALPIVHRPDKHTTVSLTFRHFSQADIVHHCYDSAHAVLQLSRCSDLGFGRRRWPRRGRLGERRAPGRAAPGSPCPSQLSRCELWLSTGCGAGRFDCPPGAAPGATSSAIALAHDCRAVLAQAQLGEQDTLCYQGDSTEGRSTANRR